jgi:exopolyphosphatase/guanosine-5'-triphosphate,3'-diphosphate pyrophosphatase
VDCGTNSLRLLVADVAADGTLTDVVRRTELVRLGAGVDRTGVLAPDALARTFAVAGNYAQVIKALGVDAARCIATSATRDAHNREDFFAGMRSALGIDAEVISGEEEARLSFRGATGPLRGVHPAPFLVVDLGGGSTELVLGDSMPVAASSMKIGSVRITERFSLSDPPAAAEIDAARLSVRAAIDAAASPVVEEVRSNRRRTRVEALETTPETTGGVPLGQTATLVGLAGSITSIAAYALGLTEYGRDRVNGAVLSPGETIDACERMLAMTRAERLALGFLPPMRADVIGAGALIWAEVGARVRDDVAEAGGALTGVVTSEHDILDGVALSL